MGHEGRQQRIAQQKRAILDQSTLKLPRSQPQNFDALDSKFFGAARQGS